MKNELLSKMPKMYDYFLKKGIELQENEIRHWIDKRVLKGSVRVFFVNTFTQDYQCLITAKCIFGLQVYYGKLELKKDYSWFYIDIPLSRYYNINKYKIIVQKDNQEIWSKTIKPSGAFENLV